MGFKIKDVKPKVKAEGKPYELIQHKTGKVGMVLNASVVQVKVALFEESNTPVICEWVLSDCSKFDGEILLKN